MAIFTGEKITAFGIFVAILIGISAFFIPEVRQFIGLENLNKTTEKVKAEPSNANTTNKSNSKTNDVNSESFSELQQTSAQEVIGWQVIASDFDVVVNESNTIITIPFKLRFDEAEDGKLYGTKSAYLADPNGKLYNIIKEEEVIANTAGDNATHYSYNDGTYGIGFPGDGRTIRQHEIYHHKLIFQKLQSKPQFLYFHYNSNNDFPPIKLMLNWAN